jgi:hypothetical protein
MPVTTIAVDEETYTRLENFKKSNKLKTFNEAVRYLLDSIMYRSALRSDSIIKIKRAYELVNSFNELSERRFVNLVAVEKILKEILDELMPNVSG